MDLISGTKLITWNIKDEIWVNDVIIVIKAVKTIAYRQGFKGLNFKKRQGVIFHDVQQGVIFHDV